MCKKNRRSEKEGDVKSGLDFFWGGGGGGGYLKHKGWLICYEKVSIATNLQLLKCIVLF